MNLKIIYQKYLFLIWVFQYNIGENIFCFSFIEVVKIYTRKKIHTQNLT